MNSSGSNYDHCGNKIKNSIKSIETAIKIMSLGHVITIKTLKGTLETNYYFKRHP